MNNPFFTPEFCAACSRAIEAFMNVYRALRDAVCQFAYAAGLYVHDLLAAVKATFVPPKWAHLARYARKKRTREKYQRMISRRFVETLREVMAT